MALCEKFEALNVFEKRDFIGTLVHCVMNDPLCFDRACDLINYAERVGILDNVVINPPQTSVIEEDNLSHV